MERRRLPVTRRVLVVEDDPGIRELLFELLTDEGHVVRCATDGHAALTVARELRPEVILLDMRLSRADGHAFLEAYRAEFGADAAAVIVMTGLMGLHPVRGADAVLAKPFTIEQVLGAIDTPRVGLPDGPPDAATA